MGSATLVSEKGFWSANLSNLHKICFFNGLLYYIATAMVSVLTVLQLLQLWLLLFLMLFVVVVVLRMLLQPSPLPVHKLTHTPTLCQSLKVPAGLLPTKRIAQPRHRCIC